MPIAYIIYLKHATSLGDNITQTRTTNTNTQKPICYSGSSYILNTPPHLAIPVHDTSDTRTLSPLLAITKWNLKLAIRRTTNTKPIQINFHFRFTIYLKHPPGFRECGSSCILNAPPLSRFRFDSYLKHAPYITSTGTRTSELIKKEPLSNQAFIVLLSFWTVNLPWIWECVRVWYRIYDICAHLTERRVVDVACPDKLASGTQHQVPERPLQANSVCFLARDTRRVVCAGEMALIL